MLIEYLYSGEATLSYQIQNKPEISIPQIAGSSFTAGQFGDVSGITVNDIDFEDLNQDGQKDNIFMRQLSKQF